MMPQVRQTVVLAIFLVASTLAHAHSIVIYHGALTWQAEALHMHLQIDQHSLDHEIMGAGRPMTVAELAAELGRALSLTTETGAVLTWSPPQLDDNGTTAGFDVRTNAGETVLAVHHRPSNRLGAIQRQFQLAWTPPSGATRVLRVTSGGNFEIIHRELKDDSSVRAAVPLDEPVLRVVLDTERRIGRIELDFPVICLRTWRRFAERIGAIISVRDVGRLEIELRNWAVQNLSLRAGTRALPLHFDGPAQLLNYSRRPQTGMDETNDDDTTIAAPLARIRITVTPETGYSLPGDSTNGAVIVDWSGFNSSVMRVAHVIQHDGNDRLHGFLNPTQSGFEVSVGD